MNYSPLHNSTSPNGPATSYATIGSDITLPMESWTVLSPRSMLNDSTETAIEIGEERVSIGRHRRKLTPYVHYFSPGQCKTYDIELGSICSTQESVTTASEHDDEDDDDDDASYQPEAEEYFLASSETASDFSTVADSDFSSVGIDFSKLETSQALKAGLNMEMAKQAIASEQSLLPPNPGLSYYFPSWLVSFSSNYLSYPFSFFTSAVGLFFNTGTSVISALFFRPLCFTFDVFYNIAFRRSLTLEESMNTSDFSDSDYYNTSEIDSFETNDLHTRSTESLLNVAFRNSTETGESVESFETMEGTTEESSNNTTLPTFPGTVKTSSSSVEMDTITRLSHTNDVDDVNALSDELNSMLDTTSDWDSAECSFATTTSSGSPCTVETTDTSSDSLCTVETVDTDVFFLPPLPAFEDLDRLDVDTKAPPQLYSSGRLQGYRANDFAVSD